MFSEEIFENRLASWAAFRDKLETTDNPVQFAYKFYDKAKRHTLQCDPWDRDSWPDPWQLVEKNIYCKFTSILGVVYSLMLCNRFQNNVFRIAICQDSSGQIDYGFSIDKKFYPNNNLQILNTYQMSLIK